MNVNDPFEDVRSASALARTIVDTARDLLLVLDDAYLVVAASRTSQAAFGFGSTAVPGVSIFDLIDGQFNVPAVRALLDGLVSAGTAIDEFALDLALPAAGARSFVLNGHAVRSAGMKPRNFLLVLVDVTDQRKRASEQQELLRRTESLLLEKDLLLQELQHRVFNSLQIIASILLMKAQNASGETRQHLEEAHERLASVAKAQRLIQAAGRGGVIEVAPYLRGLCESLAASMIDTSRPIAFEVTGSGGVAKSADAVSLGLIVTELFINALKHAFPAAHSDPRVRISYETANSNWQLVVADNGVGDAMTSPRREGIGLALVAALSGQLTARVEISSTSSGTRVSVTHEVFHSRFVSG